MTAAKSPFEFWQNPPSNFRSAPFWSWNSKLDPQRLCRAIEGMHAAGMGGFFMHARYGLKTPYLSEEWFACIAACVNKARELGMKAYLYDEDRWPSGAAGGLVTREHIEFRSHVLQMGPAEAPADQADRIATFAVELDEQGQLKSYQPVDDSKSAQATGKLMAFDVRATGPTPWHNDGTYLDAMNPRATAEFIRVTHSAYADRFGKDFGGLIPAIFMDEPNYSDGGSVFTEKAPTSYFLPWTPNLPLEFKKRLGYDIREHLPELALPASGDGWSKARHDYRQVATELFVENFTTQLGQWCGKHNIALTGHMLCEEKLDLQTRCVGAAMPHYEPMQWPGIDLLMDMSRPAELTVAKQCTSAAAQFGKERSPSEMYGCTGWDWPLEGHKFIGDWQFACGINFRVPHLTHYSLAGGAKRDYPASIFSHSPWWNCYGVVEDYFARLSYMLTQGTPVRDVLVIHPIESAWGLHRPGKGPQAPLLKSVQNSIESITATLMCEHYDWDYGDESLLAKHAKVSAGALKVGLTSYKMVIVPPCLTLRASTVKLLNRFAAAGGLVLFVGPHPQYLDGAPAVGQLSELIAACKTCGQSPDEFLPAIEMLLPRRVSITEGSRGSQARYLWTMLRSVKIGQSKGQLLFVQSHDRHAGHCVQVCIAGAGPVVMWDLGTGKTTILPSEQAGNNAVFSLQLPSSGSALVSVGMIVPGATQAAPPPAVVQTKTFAGPLEIELTEPNTLPLDYCTYRIGEGEFSQPVHSLVADTAIRKQFGLGTRMGYEHQPWYLYATGVVDVRPRGRCQTRRTFDVTQLPNVCKLAIEQPENFQITVNGQPAGQPSGHWVDEDIKTIDISGLLKLGQNEVLLTFDYRPDMELEDLYLVGDFGVSSGPSRAAVKGPSNQPDELLMASLMGISPTLHRDDLIRSPRDISLVAPSKKLDLGSWVGQGLDFYGGSVKYKLSLDKPATGRRIRIQLPGIACTAAAVYVGGQRFVLPWAPFEADITEAMADGANAVIIEVFGGRKNILGPLHVPWEAWTGPGQFNPANEKWTDDYMLVAHGLCSPVVVQTLQ